MYISPGAIFCEQEQNTVILQHIYMIYQVYDMDEYNVQRKLASGIWPDKPACSNPLFNDPRPHALASGKIHPTRACYHTCCLPQANFSPPHANFFPPTCVVQKRSHTVYQVLLSRKTPVQITTMGLDNLTHLGQIKI